MKNKKLFTLLILGMSIFSFSFFIPQSTSAEEKQADVEYGMIQELAGLANYPKQATYQVMPEIFTVAYNLVNPNDPINAQIILQDLYPNYTPERLQNVTADDKQLLEFTKKRTPNVKYKEGYLDIETIKTEITNHRPIVAFLTCNSNYWYEKQSAVLIWGYQVYPVTNSDGTTHEATMLMTISMNHANPTMSTEIGWDKIKLLDTTIDPEATTNATYTWTSSIYGFNK